MNETGIFLPVQEDSQAASSAIFLNHLGLTLSFEELIDFLDEEHLEHSQLEALAGHLLNCFLYGTVTARQDAVTRFEQLGQERVVKHLKTIGLLANQLTQPVDTSCDVRTN